MTVHEQDATPGETVPRTLAIEAVASMTRLEDREKSPWKELGKQKCAPAIEIY